MTRIFSLKNALLLVLLLLARVAESRSELHIHGLPRSLVERVEYLGRGAFSVTLLAVKLHPLEKPKLFFDGRERLAFVIEPDALDGTLIEMSGAERTKMRTDVSLKGAAFVNLLLAAARERGEIELSCAFVPAESAGRTQGAYRLIYFQVTGK